MATALDPPSPERDPAESLLMVAMMATAMTAMTTAPDPASPEKGFFWQVCQELLVLFFILH